MQQTKIRGPQGELLVAQAGEGSGLSVLFYTRTRRERHNGTESRK